VGGGLKAKPGEISLAHHGILFLDELPEFSRTPLEALRQPLECGEITIARANAHVTYPSKFQLIAAMNPCLCGYFGSQERACSKAPVCAQNYQARLSGPLLDRIDLHVEVTPVPFKDLAETPKGEVSASIRARVMAAKKIQETRFATTPDIFSNAQMSSKDVDKYCILQADGFSLLKTAMERLSLSARAFVRIKKVARTIADLDNSADIKAEHLAEAIQFRSLDRESWGS